MSAWLALVRLELRLLRHDPMPAVVLVAVPIVLMTLLSPALQAALLVNGRFDAPGSAQSVPGMACVFAFFLAGTIGFGVFREHGWHTWPRLRAAGLTRTQLIAGKLVVPAGLLVVQHVVLFAFGVLALDLEVAGSWVALAMVALAYGAVVLTAGLALAVTVSTIQQVNAFSTLGAMVLGALGGGFVPTASLPEWVQPVAPASPVHMAMDGYVAVILDGGGPGDVLGAVAVLVGIAAALALVAAHGITRAGSRRAWG